MSSCSSHNKRSAAWARGGGADQDGGAEEEMNNKNKNKRVKTSGDDDSEASLSLLDVPSMSGGRCRTNDEVHSSISICAVMKMILDTPHMQRLRHVKQLANAEQVYMNCNHTRFEHSLGVAALAGEMCLQMCQEQKALRPHCSAKDILCVKLAGLLHDVGHGPFSHTFETFVKHDLVQYVANNPDLYAFYQDASRYPTLPRNWSHEMVSIAMVDAVLQYLGLAIDLDKLDEPLKPMGKGISPYSMRVTEGIANPSSANLKDLVLTSRDWVFIKECIYGKPLPGCNQLLGRTKPEQQWLYDIVNNRQSGLDVDKVDYFARDDRRADRQSGEITKPMVKEARVAKVMEDGEVHYRICYRKKNVEAAMQFFRKRYDMHHRIYRHKTNDAVAQMISDILCLADAHFFIPTDPDEAPPPMRNAIQRTPPFDELPMSRAMLDPNSFLHLRDDVLCQITREAWQLKRQGRPSARLNQAAQLIRRLEQHRDLYKCVHTQPLDIENQVDQEIAQMKEGDIQNHILKQVKGGPSVVNKEDFVVSFCNIHFGKKDKNPLEFMRFVPEDKKQMLTRAKSMDELPFAKKVLDKAIKDMPRRFQSRSLRVIARDGSKVHLIRDALFRWFTLQGLEFDDIHEDDDEEVAAGMEEEQPAVPATKHMFDLAAVYDSSPTKLLQGGGDAVMLTQESVGEPDDDDDDEGDVLPL